MHTYLICGYITVSIKNVIWHQNIHNQQGTYHQIMFLFFLLFQMIFSDAFSWMKGLEFD